MKIKEILKTISLRRLFILIFLLIFNAYAWFVFITRGETSITTHVASWEIQFKNSEEQIVSVIEIDIEKIYPGMEPYIYTMEANNLGEMNAVVTYEIREISILGEVYTVGVDDLTTEDLLTMLTDGTYPFDIQVVMDNDGEIEAETGVCEIKIIFTWDYELEGELVTDQEKEDRNARDTELRRSIL